VSLFDRGPFGGEASWAGGGILSPLYPWRYADAVNSLTTYSQSLYPTLMEELKSITGIDTEWINSGLLILDIADQESAIKWAETNHISMQAMDMSSIELMEPQLGNPDYQNSVYMPEVTQVRNPRFIEAMQAYLRQAGAKLYADNEVSEINYKQGSVHGVSTKNGEKYEADNVIIANGAWSGHLLRQMQIDLQIHPVRGQMLLLKSDTEHAKHIILKNDHYIIPRSDGHIIVGSTLEHTGFDNSTTHDAYDELLNFAYQLMPSLENCSIKKQWSGLRPGCGQGIPYIGEHPEYKGLYVNAGHYRNGIVMSPGSAELLANLIFKEITTIDQKPYSLSVYREWTA